MSVRRKMQTFFNHSVVTGCGVHSTMRSMNERTVGLLFCAQQTERFDVRTFLKWPLFIKTPPQLRAAGIFRESKLFLPASGTAEDDLGAAAAATVNSGTDERRKFEFEG